METKPDSIGRSWWKPQELSWGCTHCNTLTVTQKKTLSHSLTAFTVEYRKGEAKQKTEIRLSKKKKKENWNSRLSHRCDTERVGHKLSHTKSPINGNIYIIIISYCYGMATFFSLTCSASWALIFPSFVSSSSCLFTTITLKSVVFFSLFSEPWAKRRSGVREENQCSRVCVILSPFSLVTLFFVWSG